MTMLGVEDFIEANELGNISALPVRAVWQQIAHFVDVHITRAENAEADGPTSGRLALTAENVMEVARRAITRHGDATGGKLGASIVVGGLDKIKPFVIATVDEMIKAETHGKGTEA